jgi:hypothetical protein
VRPCRRRGVLVVAHGDDRSADAGAADAVDEEDASTAKSTVMYQTPERSLPPVSQKRTVGASGSLGSPLPDGDSRSVKISQVRTVRAKPRVTTARYRPLMRRAGTPTMTAATTPQTTPSSSATR